MTSPLWKRMMKRRHRLEPAFPTRPCAGLRRGRGSVPFAIRALDMGKGRTSRLAHPQGAPRSRASNDNPVGTCHTARR